MAKQKILGKELGSSGVNVSQGIITGEEYNPKLTGVNALKAYDEMRRSDATVKAGLRAIKLPIKSAEYRIDAAEDDENREVAGVVQTCLFHIIDWNKFLNEALTHLEFGFTVFEMVFEPRYIDGVLRIALVKLGYRKPTTISSWETQDHQPGIQQQLPTGTTVSMPLEKLIVLTNDQEGDNYQGTSILRAAYKHWYIKDRLYRIDAVGHERQALGVLDITVPKGAQEEDKIKIRKAAKNLRANESSYIEHPEGWIIEFMNMQAKSMKDVEPSINHHNRQIFLNVLTQFLDNGSSGAAGSRSTSEDHSRLFELAIKDTANYIVQRVQNTAVRLITDLNFTNREYPTLAVGNISDENIPVVSEAIGKLVTAGVLHPDSADENNVRKMIGWQQVDEDELDKRFSTPTPSKDANIKDLKASRVLADARLAHASLTGVLYGNTPRAA